MAIFKTYEQIGIEENVSSLITDITPSDTPLYSAIKSEKVHNRVYQYQTDALPAAGANAQLEGFTASAGTIQPTTMISGNTQVMSKVFEISKSSDAVSTYGRASETAYALARHLKMLKRDIEFAYVGVDNATVTGNATTAREMPSVSQLISSTTTVDAGSGSTDALTEAKLTTLMQTCYNEGAEPSVMMVKPADSLIIAGFTGSAGRTREFNDGNTTLTNVVDLYVSPFGQYKVQLNRHLMSTHLFLLDPTMWRTAVLRPVTRTALAIEGDSQRHMLVYEGGLMHKNPLGSGQINGLS